MKRTKQSTFAKRERSEKSTGFAPVGSEDMTHTTKHTPGPWIVEDYFVFASNTLRIADCDCDEQDMPESEIEANTHLIAAAPAMYEAIRKVIEHRAKDYLDNTIEPYCSLVAALAQADGKQ